MMGLMAGSFLVVSTLTFLPIQVGQIGHVNGAFEGGSPQAWYSVALRRQVRQIVGQRRQ